LGRSLQSRSNFEPLDRLPGPEAALAARDRVLARLIAVEKARWPSVPIEDPIWGLIRMVMAQQISTQLACRMAERVQLAFPSLVAIDAAQIPKPAELRKFGLSERRAQCCITILTKSPEIRRAVARGASWSEALAGIKGIGPWTLSVFRIMVLREPDVLPAGDVGLERAIRNIYGDDSDAEIISEFWRPFRSVACWYLWRTLGNVQLG